MHASEVALLSNEPQRVHVNRLRDLLSDYDASIRGKGHLALTALKTPRLSVGRCWLLDDMVYFTPHFQPHVLAPVLVAPEKSELYTAVASHFSYLWDEATRDPNSRVFEK